MIYFLLPGTSFSIERNAPKSFEEKQLQEPLEYRRFHSIFTSGTWSPLGKRNVLRPMIEFEDYPYEDAPRKGLAYSSDAYSSLPSESEDQFLSNQEAYSKAQRRIP